VGMNAVIETARALGLTSDLAPVPAAALGAFEVTPRDLALAYVPFASGGVRPGGLTTVRAVHDADGDLLHAADAEPARVITPAAAYLMTSLLQGVVDAGTAASVRALGLSAPAAGKTGTTNDARDAWFVGYTPTLLALVWVGFDNNEAHGLTGNEGAVPIWTDFMKQALDAYPSPGFTVPEGVTVTTIDTTNGKVANRFCPITAREVFLAGTEPEVCTEHGGISDHIGDWWRRFRDWLRH
jgi:penicillin-binding protein 1B